MKLRTKIKMLITGRVILFFTSIVSIIMAYIMFKTNDATLGVGYIFASLICILLFGLYKDKEKEYQKQVIMKQEFSL